MERLWRPYVKGEKLIIFLPIGHFWVKKIFKNIKHIREGQESTRVIIVRKSIGPYRCLIVIWRGRSCRNCLAASPAAHPVFFLLRSFLGIGGHNTDFFDHGEAD